MSQVYPEFELPRWVLNSTGSTDTSLKGNLAGSAAAPVSLEEVIACSSDPDTTRKNLQFHDLTLGLGEYAGDAQLRETITELYDTGQVDVKADDVVIANATTGANALVFHSLVKHGDHIICLYPVYGQLVQYPAAMGVEVSHWRLREEKGWELDIEDLKALIRTDGDAKTRTKMLVLNNPHNPTGTVLTTALQQQIVQICKENDIIIFSDEIFRPLFHSPPSSAAGEHPATSLLEHSTQEAYDKIIVTGSLSKPWGLSGIRVGWVVTLNPELRRIFISMRQWSISSVSVIDEVIAREALSSRCRGVLLDKTLASARMNLPLLRKVVEESKGRLACRFPAGGGTAFVRVLSGSEDGKEGVDDVAFCQALMDNEGMLFAPGSLTFGGMQEGDFRGFVRVHITAPPEMFKKGVEGLKRFLEAGGGGLKN